MQIRQPSRPAPLPRVWLVSDARNDAVLEQVMTRLPRGSGLIFRHYHLPPDERFARLADLRRVARRRGHVLILSGTTSEALRRGADGAYGAARLLARGPDLLRLITVHSLHELRLAHAARADAVLISPVFATASHPGAKALGPVKLRLLAARARVPVIALGGMTAHQAARHGIARWAAIDGLSR